MLIRYLDQDHWSLFIPLFGDVWACVYFLRRGEGGEGEGVYKEVDGDVNMEDEQIGRKVNKVDDEGRRGNLSPKRPTRFFVILFESFLKI